VRQPFEWSSRRGIGRDSSLAYGTFKEGPPTLGRDVGAAFFAACRDAGLDVEWTGSPEAYVEMPRFCWQRRLTVTRESDIRDFLESWEMEIRAGYTAADTLLEALDERAADWFESFSDFGPKLRERLRAHTERFIADEQLRESKWTDPTMNDRLTGAFDELNRQGVLAQPCQGLTIQDGWAYSGVEGSADQRGVAFFQHEDIIDAVGGGGLLIAFGAIGVDPAEDDAATLALGHQIVSVLERNGVPCRWSQSIRERIRIEPFEWRKRRWTAAPPYERLAARQMRAIWKELGNSGDAQVGHVGLPHAFVRAGEVTSMAPQPAIENLREEKDGLFDRGRRSKHPSS
jgi:hypothetical protein